MNPRSGIKGSRDAASENIFIYYGLCSIYKSYIHFLNHFEDNFDYMSHFRHLVFGRILTEFHVSLRGGKVLVENFHRKWKRFKLYVIKNNQIHINLNLK